MAIEYGIPRITTSDFERNIQTPGRLFMVTRTCDVSINWQIRGCLIRARQAESFRAHCVAGRETGLPVIVHTRNADAETATILQEESGAGALRGVIHCFSATRDFAMTALDLGFYISLSGIVTFSARQDSWAPWLDTGKVTLGRQPIDAAVYRQSYKFKEAGDYLISAEFAVDGEPHILDFPMRVGAPALFGPTGIIVAGVAFILLCVTLLQRRRSMTGRIRSTREQQP